MRNFKNKLNLFIANSRVAMLSATSIYLGLVSTNVYAAADDNLGRKVIEQSTAKLTDLLDSTVTLLQVVMGIGAIVVLAIVIFKVFKGDREAAEKLAWWVAGLTLGFALMAVVKNLIPTK